MIAIGRAVFNDIRAGAFAGRRQHGDTAAGQTCIYQEKELQPARWRKCLWPLTWNGISSKNEILELYVNTIYYEMDIITA